MWKIRLGKLWVCNCHAYLYYFLVLSCISLNQCQVIRKSIEIPVKDYLTPPVNGKSEWSQKDNIYVQADDSDSVRHFEAFSPHTPASALVFSGVLNQPLSRLSTTQSTFLQLTNGNGDEKKLQGVSLPTLTPTMGELLNHIYKPAISLPLSLSPSTRMLEEGLNAIQRGYSFSFSTPTPDLDNQNSNLDNPSPYNTPLPAMRHNNDPIFGYFNVAYDDENRNPQAKANTYDAIPKYPTQQEYTVPYEDRLQAYPIQSPEYVPHMIEKLPTFLNYDSSESPSTNSGSSERNRGELHKTITNHRRKKYKKLKESLSNAAKSSERNDNQYTQVIYKPNQTSSPEIEMRDNKKQINSPNKGQRIINNGAQILPTVPPTIGVIGWKSNADEGSWKPSKNLMNMANQYIDDDLKAGPQNGHPPSTNDGQESQRPSQGGEEDDEEEDGEEGEEESEEEGEEEEEEEEIDEEKAEEQYKKDNNDDGREERPPPSSQYESSQDYSERPTYGNSPYENTEDYSDSSQPPNRESDPYASRPPPPRYESSAEYDEKPPPLQYEGSDEYQNRPPSQPSHYENSLENQNRSPPSMEYESSSEYSNGTPPPPPNKGSVPYSDRAPPSSHSSQSYSDEHSENLAPPSHIKHSQDAYSYSHRSQSNEPQYDSSENYKRLPSSIPEISKPKKILPGYSQSPSSTPTPYGSPHQYSDSLDYKQKSSSFDNDYEIYDPLPPGPPYLPPPNQQDPKTNGYVPLPSFSMGVKPSENFKNGIQQTWTPITPAPTVIPSGKGKNIQQYKTTNGRWLRSGGPILESTFSQQNEFSSPTWLNDDKLENQIDDNEQSTKNNVKKAINSKNKKPESETRNKDSIGSDYIKSKDLPLEHRGNRDFIEGQSSKKRESLETHEEMPFGPNYRSPVKQEKNRVSDHEFARKVPTRLRYPGGGLWARPQVGSGAEMDFVPKKVYTQTRKYNTAQHLPREAALADASTPEEIVNAPRLREVVTHKKTQEVYEEEGYEDAGYDHGGYKKKGQSESDTERHDSEEDVLPVRSRQPTEEEAFEDHVTQLEAIPNTELEDPSSQSTANRKSIHARPKPNVHVSWKQQKTTTDEKSMAFLDEKGSGGILTQKHVPKLEGVTGKYEGLEGYNYPAVQGENENGKVLHEGGGVSFQRFNPTKMLQGTETPMYIKDLNSALASQDHDMNEKYFNPTHSRIPIKQDSNLKSKVRNHHRFILPESQLDIDEINSTSDKEPKRSELISYRSKNNRYTPPRKDQIPLIELQPHKLFYMQRNDSSLNNSSSKEYTDDREKNNYDNPVSSIHHYNQKTYHYPLVKKGGRFLTFPTESSYSNISRIVSGSPKSVQPKRNYQTQRSQYNTQVVHPQITSLEDVSFPFSQPEYDYESPSKERRSRDLTSVGVEGNIDYIIPQSEISRAPAALRLLEEQLAPVSSGNSGNRNRPRHNSRETSSSGGRKYKEIDRNPSPHSNESSDERKDRALEVKVQEDEVNVRHPFLPRDGKGENIDYVKLRMEYDATTVPIKERIRDEYDLIPEVVEKPQTTTTPRVTTAKTTPPTTTEYVPEDPAETLKRLKHNPFLTSIFPQSEEDETETATPPSTTTTPKITTYRAKTTTIVSKLVENPEDSFDRLKSNPFLSTYLSSQEKTADYVQTQRRRGSRKMPIIVMPDMPDGEKGVKHVEQLTLAQYSGPSHGLMYKTIPRRTQQRMTVLAEQLNNEGIGKLHIVVRRSVRTEPKENVVVMPAKSTSETSVDEEMYPFYNSPASVSFPLYSPVRYALNPKYIPVKTSGGMEFYESRDKSVNCEEPTPPKGIVPKRGKDGEWNQNPQNDKPRLGKLGDKIDCLKSKYFGADPLDNPFFKEINVEVPNFKPKSKDDSFGFHADIKENINSEVGSLSEQFYEDKGQEVLQDSTGGFSSKSQTRPIHVKPTRIISIYTDKNKTTRSPKVPLNTNFKNGSFRDNEDLRTKATGKEIVNTTNRDNITRIHFGLKTKNIPILKLNTSFEYPKELHQPQKVTISIKSKGTSNHPKIKGIKETLPKYNEAIKIIPRSTMGYLKSYSPLRIKNYPNKVTENMSHGLSDVSLLTAASGLKNTVNPQKRPAKVDYFILNHQKQPQQQKKTFITAPFQQSTLKPSMIMNNSPKTSNLYLPNWWKLPISDEKSSEPKYRVKRNNENDKYINSKESMELKNFLLKKYANILAKDNGESTRKEHGQSQSTDADHSPFAVPPTAVSNKNRLPYSSRYSASDPMYESSTAEVEIDKEKKESESQEHPTVSRFPTRKPKIRFPKLSINPRPPTEKERVKFLNIPEIVQVKTITTTTTTTPSPPTTTTRMYKPRVVYKKEYGKPLDKVVNMFEVLKHRPKSIDEATNIPSTERVQESTLQWEERTEPGRKPNRKYKPKRLEQFEHRRITKEEVFKKSYTPEDYARERSDIVEVYDHGIEHPDLTGRVSRMSRDSPVEYSSPTSFHDMLVYMVDPLTRAGEWKVIPVALSAISRVDPNFQSLVRDPAIAQQALIQSSHISKQRKRDKSKPLHHRDPSIDDRGRVQPSPDSMENTQYRYTSRQREATTEPHKQPRNKSRRKIRPNKNQEAPRSRYSQEPPPKNEERSTTPIPDSRETTGNLPSQSSMDDDFTSTTTQSKVIMEPYKRKYFYAKTK